MVQNCCKSKNKTLVKVCFSTIMRHILTPLICPPSNFKDQLEGELTYGFHITKSKCASLLKFIKPIFGSWCWKVNWSNGGLLLWRPLCWQGSDDSSAAIRSSSLTADKSKPARCGSPPATFNVWIPLLEHAKENRALRALSATSYMESNWTLSTLISSENWVIISWVKTFLSWASILSQISVKLIF